MDFFELIVAKPHHPQGILKLLRPPCLYFGLPIWRPFPWNLERDRWFMSIPSSPLALSIMKLSPHAQAFFRSQDCLWKSNMTLASLPTSLRFSIYPQLPVKTTSTIHTQPSFFHDVISGHSDHYTY